MIKLDLFQGHKKDKKNHIITSMDQEDTFDKIQHSFIIKTFIKVVIAGT